MLKKKILYSLAVFAENSVPLTRFLKAPYYYMPYIFSNMVYLNIKERDRF